MRRWSKSVIIAAVWSLLLVQLVSAAEPGTILSADIESGKIILYVQNPGEVSELKCQVGTSACDQISFQLISEREKPVHTIILVDNSLSIASAYRPLISEIISNLAANRMSGEVFTLATFSDKLTYLVEESSDYTKIKQTADGIVYEDQETYLTDVLYELLMTLNSGEDTTLKRIILFSDGVDNKTIGYTKEELYALLKTHSYPIYTLGCSNKSNNDGEKLKNMFALSRQTQGLSWMLNEVTDSLQVIGGVAQGNDVLRVEILPPDAVCDGTDKGIKLTMIDGEQKIEASTVVEMPFVLVESQALTVEATQEVKATQALETVEEILPDSVEKPIDGGNKKTLVYLSIAGILIVLAAVLTVLIIRYWKAKKEEEQFESVLPDGNSFSLQQDGGVRSAVSPTEFVKNEDSSDTAVVWMDQAPARTLILWDQANPARRFEVPLSKMVSIGRDSAQCKIVLDYDKSISSHHCDILQENGTLYVRDNNSTNQTHLDGRQVIGKAEIHSQCILTLGRLNLKVEIR